MKEIIYTIPVTEAFGENCECPMCVLEKRLEDEYVEYFLGPSLMEPDHRVETNENGFCRRHFELLYNSRQNRLGLGLTVSTHLREQNDKFKKIFENKIESIKEDSGTSLFRNMINKISKKRTEAQKLTDEIIAELKKLEGSCSLCRRLDNTMDRYVDVIFHLWLKEEEFKNSFNSSKGFCFKHLKDLLEGTKKHLAPREAALFVGKLLQLQFENTLRIQSELDWFTKKFDYRYNEAPWEGSKDALPRCIQKIVGNCDLK